MRLAIAILAVLLRAVAADAAGETVIRDLKNTKIIRSQEQPHNILNEACIACHPKEKFDFWLLIYKGKPPSVTIDRPEDKGFTAGIAAETATAAPKSRYNSHESLACNFCHFGNPTAASPRFIVDVQELCRMCHTAVEMHFIPAGDNLARINAAIAAKKLPGREGRFLCTTCHKVHDSTYGMRDAYTRILSIGTVPNPHGSRSYCFACHQGAVREGKEPSFVGGKDNTSLCNDCHLRPGIKRSPHVVGVGSGEGTWRMDYLGYPLADGKLICSTCHEEVSHGKKDAANPRFLRGGPYADTELFCYRCHLEDKAKMNNPHNQVDSLGGIRRSTCRVCHRNDPDVSKPKPSDRVMASDEKFICAGCHEARPHPSKDHLVKLPEAMARRKDEYERQHQVRLPLGEGGMIRCSTCHNPHAKGVLKGEAGVGAGSKLRAPDFREVCAPCHSRY